MRVIHDARRFAGAAALVLVGLGGSAAALLFVVHPAAAASALATVQSAVTCAVTGANSCVSGNNTNSGIGVLGSSKTGTGVRGSANTNYGVKGSSGSSYGVFGTTTSGFAGVAGTSNGSAGQIGVYGYTTGNSEGFGVKGDSSGTRGAGVVGVGNTSTQWGVLGIGEEGIGVEGDALSSGTGLKANVTDNATGLVVKAANGTGIQSETAGTYGVTSFSTNANGIGVYGSAVAAGGNGIYGVTRTGTGVSGIATDTGGIGVHARSDGSYAILADARNFATGLWINTESGTGIYVEGGSGGGPGIIATSYLQGGYLEGANQGLYAYSPTGTSLIAGSNNGTTFSVDQYGNVSYSGSLLSNARVAGGANVTAFTAKTTAPTVEDTGTAQLVAGSAVVRLDPTFAASIDPTTVYRVFVTPDGDMSHGLFVAVKSANGFIVREMQGGRSSVTFDYRIVATALGKAGQRMAVTSAMPRIQQPAPPRAATSSNVRRAVPTPAPIPPSRPLPPGALAKPPPAN